jgi:RNA polymerase sigma factor (sigma-70 family)
MADCEDNPAAKEVCDAELLRQMATAAVGSDEGKAAWEEFYNRHRRYLYGVCRRAYNETLGEARIVELVQDTFIRVYQKARTFKPVENEDAVVAGRRVRGWLGQISENIVHDSFRNEPQVVFMDEDELPDRGDSGNSAANSQTSSERLKRLEKVMASLTDREQEVLRATAMWYRPGQRQQRLPNSVMNKLATSLNTTSDNIRQIRSRAMAKVRKSME